MDRLISGLCLLAVLLVSCGPSSPASPASHPAWWAGDWATAWFYEESRLTEEEQALVAQLEPAGGEGRVALSFTEDFDGDGALESVHWGAYTKTNGEAGNFVLLERTGTATTVLLLQEFPGPQAFTVFTLKPDGSLWFGGGIDAGEVTLAITWESGQPVLHRLGLE